MIKSCNSYGVSPPPPLSDFLYTEFSLDDLYYNSSPSDGLLSTDQEELYSDCPWPSSIGDDLIKIEDGAFDNNIFTDLMDNNPMMKSDCMWSSGKDALLSTSASSTGSSEGAAAVPFAAVTNYNSQQQLTNFIKQENCTSEAVMPGVAMPTQLSFTTVKMKPVDDNKSPVVIQRHTISNNVNNNKITENNNNVKNQLYIPPGTSLLRKSVNQQSTKKQQRYATKMNNNKTPLIQITAEQFIRERENQLLESEGSAECEQISYPRPETPPDSLEDDDTDDTDDADDHASVDLSACLTGSNSISLAHGSTDPSIIINLVSQDLQDTSKHQIDMRFMNTQSKVRSLSEVLDVIVKDNSSHSATNDNIFGTTSDTDSEEYDDGRMSSSDCSNSRQSKNNYRDFYHQHSDHSYTRCKDGMDDLSTNLETPSDSDEEIDVVSIGDKKLPTNPSDRDRRALQTKVAYKFSNSSRILKGNVNTNGCIRPNNRRVSYDLPYTPASNSPVKSVNNSRYPSPANTPHCNGKQQQQVVAAVLSGDNPIAPINILRGLDGVQEKPRKRGYGNGIEPLHTPTKKHRGKKAANFTNSKFIMTTTMTTVATSPLGSGIMTTPFKQRQQQLSSDESQDTIEKRNLHNNMERQRRIGLKNLFEALKRQIPSIKDKERAPKVNILREAAKLCTALSAEDKMLTEEKAKLTEELKQRQELIAQLLSVKSNIMT